MFFIRRIFTKTNNEDYETILSNLANDIQKRQLKLSEIRLRERRSTLLATLYTLGVWVAYVSVWYWDSLPAISKWETISNPRVAKGVKFLPVIFGPVIILFIRRIVQIWYKRKGDAEEKTVQILTKERRDKVEEIKKKTNYYSTRDLIQRYDEPSPATPLRPRVIPRQPLPTTPQHQPFLNNINPNVGKSSGVNPTLQAQLSPTTPPFPMQPQRRQWYDRLADSILGEDDPIIASPSSRYALICEKCFAHNGLVKESMWEDAQYVCPKCNHFNASTRSKRSRQQQDLSPTASATLSPTSIALTTPSRQPSPTYPPLLHSPQESELPNVDRMEVDTEVDTSS
ncbi:hypothetical protein BYT27DRAFT_7258855 [Phlegmacium glaucopus]|nr:hypothetical protein BYT27DRAFT_7258855 [Phlegmacium glaucopus]